MFKSNASGSKKTLAFLAVALFTLFTIGFGTSANGEITSGITYKVYKDYSIGSDTSPPTTFGTTPLCSSGTAININWTGLTTFPDCGTGNILIHYDGFLTSASEQTLYFQAESTGCVYVTIGETSVANTWTGTGSCSSSPAPAPVSFLAGETKPIHYWYFGGTASAKKAELWMASDSAMTNAVVTPSDMFIYDYYEAVNFIDTAIQEYINPSTFSYTSVEASGSGNIWYTVTDGTLPPGISLNETTGRLSKISGATLIPGTYSFKILAHAQDGDRSTNAETPTLTMIVGKAPSFTVTSSDTEVWIGQRISQRIETDSYPENPEITISQRYPDPQGLQPNEIAPGVRLNSDGTITGVTTTAGRYYYRVKAHNPVMGVNYDAYSGTGDYGPWHILKVKAAPRFGDVDRDDDYVDYFSTSLEAGHNYSRTPSVSGDERRFTLKSGNLPPGLVLDADTGILSGTATVGGSYTFEIEATNPSGSDLSGSSTINVGSRPSFTDTDVASNASVGTEFRGFTFKASGYPTAEFFAARSNSLNSNECTGLRNTSELPAGLTLSRNGLLSGTPTSIGSYTFTICAVNDRGWVEIERTINVNQPPQSLDDILALNLNLGSAYSDAVSYRAYPPPIYSLSEGQLPPGLELDSETGAIEGTPSANGEYRFKISVESGINSVDTNTYLFKVFQTPTASDIDLVQLTDFGKPYTDGVSVISYPAAVFSVDSGALPKGLALDSATGALVGTPTVAGKFPFSITAKNSVGSLKVPYTLVVQQAPIKVKVTGEATTNMGMSYSAKVTSEGFPLPTYSVTSGALPEGLALDKTTGEISGVATTAGSYNFVITASNAAGKLAATPFALEVVEPKSEIQVKAEIGSEIASAQVVIKAEGFKPNSTYQVVLRSTPQVIAEGVTGPKGEIADQAKIPSDIEPGWHSITVVTTKSDGTAFEKAVYFQITETKLLEEISEKEPTPAQKTEALTNDPEFYARMGMTEPTAVTAEAAAAQVGQVTSVVASVALVSAAAAGAAAAASAAGGAASSAGGGSSGGARSGGGSSGGGSSGGSNSDDSDGGDYGNIEADHDDFETEGSGFVDRLKIWRMRWLTSLDKPLTNWIEASARVSPVLSRIINDGSYLRALFGSVTGVGYLAALGLGVAAVDTGADSLATSGRVGVLVAIMALGTLDALLGVLAMSTFVVTSLIALPFAGIGDIRYLLAMFILGFAPSIMATTFRKIRRPAIENLSDAWERVIDLALIGFISVLTVMSLVGSVSAFAGAKVPLGADVKPIAFAIAAVALTRVVVEELAAKLAPERLNRINPTEVPSPFGWQPWASLALKAGVLVIMIGGMVGMGWHLWVGTALIFLPGIIGMVFPNLPSFKLIHEFIPGGVGALAFATLLSGWSGQLVNFLLGKSELYGALSFILIPFPVILVAILGMFAKPEEKLWQRTGKKWIYVAGGIAVFALTVQVTNFIPTIFG